MLTPLPFLSSSTILTLKLQSLHVRPFFSPVPQAWHCTQERRSSQRPRRIWVGREEQTLFWVDPTPFV